jgi:acyl carrier protein
MEEQIIEKIAEISETDVVKKDTLLKDLEVWDSLAMITFIVYTNSEFNVKFDNVDVLRDAVSVGDLCNLVVERMS